MSNFYAIKTFGLWVKENKSMFKHPPKIDKKEKKYFIANFVGIKREISLIVSNRGTIDIGATYTKYDSFDGFIDFDIFEKRTSKGKYYCSECLNEYQKLYDSRKNLWIKHSFEPLAEWLNEKFIPSNYLVFLDYGEGSFAAEIVNKEKLLKYKNNSKFEVKSESLLL